MKTFLSLAFLVAVAISQVQANVIVTYAENPGDVTTSLKGTSIFDFNNLSLGTNTNVAWSGVGSFDQLYVHKADVYGGAAGSDYSVQGINSPVSQTVLTLSSPSAYFGLWWSAGDKYNELKFYNGTTLVADFTTDNLVKVLTQSSTDYYGNPNTGYSYSGGDGSEPFAYINFFAMDGTTWTSIVFSNSSSSGFESDNYSSRVTAYSAATDGAMPGIAFASVNGTQVVPISQAPEPNTYLAMIAFGGLSVAGSVMQRLRKRKLAKAA